MIRNLLLDARESVAKSSSTYAGDFLGLSVDQDEGPVAQADRYNGAIPRVDAVQPTATFEFGDCV
jgi:hypothetical protein